MKKLLTSAGLVVLGTASIQAAYTPDLSQLESSKPWSVSAALRGFYDDNYTTSPSNARRSSIGYEVAPSASLNLPMEQTFIGLSYDYSLKYYEDRPNHKYDQSHKFDGRLDHAFSERYKLAISDSFVVSQEPEVLDRNGAVASPLRTPDDNIRNYGKIDFTAQATEQFGVEVSYANTFYDYRQDGAVVAAGPTFVSASRSGLLDRLEHLIGLSLRWQFQPDTVGLLGYQFGIVDFTSKEPIGQDPVTGNLISADVRNSYTHYLFVGADHRFNSQFTASIRVGGQYVDYHEQDRSEISPYADASITYTYNQGSYIQAGVSHTRARTDVATIQDGNDVTSDQEVTAVYASINHKITPKLIGSLTVQGQRGVFEGGTADADIEYFFISGVNLSYNFNPHFAVETGYNFDRLDSDQPNRSYTRNRVYIGVRGTY